MWRERHLNQNPVTWTTTYTKLVIEHLQLIRKEAHRQKERKKEVKYQNIYNVIFKRQFLLAESMSVENTKIIKKIKK